VGRIQNFIKKVKRKGEKLDKCGTAEFWKYGGRTYVIDRGQISKETVSTWEIIKYNMKELGVDKAKSFEEWMEGE